MSGAPRRAASRLAVVGAALSLAAAAGGAAPTLAADRAAGPDAPVANSPGAKAAPKSPAKADEAAVDDELIEFLGSVGDGGDDGDWLDFLTRTDIDKVAKRGSKTPPGGR